MADIAMAQTQDGDDVARLQWAWASQTSAQVDQAEFIDAFVHRWVTELDRRPTWTARVDGSLQGFLSAVRIDSLPWPGREGASWLHVAALYVVPSQRGQGIGAALLTAVRDHGEQRECRVIRLHAAEPATDLYLGQGYQRDSHAMWLDLRKP